MRERSSLRRWDENPHGRMVALTGLSAKGIDRAQHRLCLDYHPGAPAIRRVVDDAMAVLSVIPKIMHRHFEQAFFLGTLEHALAQNRHDHVGEECDDVTPQAHLPRCPRAEPSCSVGPRPLMR